MAGLAVRESITVAGRAERAQVARVFVAGVLGADHPFADDAVLPAGELFANRPSLPWTCRHTRAATRRA
jgi:hypothetical protein